MSASEPNDPGASAASAYRELEALVRHLTDELASFRRRALAAEAKLRAHEQAAGAADAPPADRSPVPDPQRLAELERENVDLRRRVEQAGTRTRQLLERVRFLRQQHGVGGSP